MKLETKNKIFRYTLITISIILLMLIIILPPIMCEVVWLSEGALRAANHGSEIIIMVLVPFLTATNLYQLSRHYKSFTKQDAINQIEKQKRANLISDKQYFENLKHLDLYEFKKQQDKASVEMEKIKLYNDVEKERKKLEKELKQTAQELTN